MKRCKRARKKNVFGSTEHKEGEQNENLNEVFQIS